jgi:hypothetical protein
MVAALMCNGLFVVATLHSAIPLLQIFLLTDKDRKKKPTSG